MAEQMKPSGIDWIGDIPESWKVKPLKYLAKCNQDVLLETTAPDYSFRYVDIGSVTSERGITEYQELRFEDSPSRARRRVSVGDTIISTVRTYLKAIAIISDSENVIVSTGFAVYTPDKAIYPQYLYYFCKSEGFVQEIDKNSYGIAYPAINTDLLSRICIAYPCYEEQQVIADFLDKECARIDSIAADLEKQVALLQQYKKSLITETVTKGLDKSVPMKDSGVEWIGEIPNTWDCKKMKYVISEPLQYGANEAGDDYREDYPRYIRITDITEENSLKDDGKLSLSPDIAKPYLLKDGDLLFARSGATVGKTFYYTSNYGTCAFAGYLIKARFNQDKMNPKFVYYTTLGIGYENWKNTVFTQATIQNIGADKYAQLYITVPSMKEQNEIIAYLDTQCKAIDDVIHSKYQQLSTIQQHKKSLIYEYVTGKKTSEGGAVRWPSKQGN